MLQDGCWPGDVPDLADGIVHLDWSDLGPARGVGKGFHFSRLHLYHDLFDVKCKVPRISYIVQLLEPPWFGT